jgi:hypothetical protein
LFAVAASGPFYATWLSCFKRHVQMSGQERSHFRVQPVGMFTPCRITDYYLASFSAQV